MSKYDFVAIENKWQKIWDYEQVFFSTPDSGKKKHYVLEMLPYPSGQIHMGHVRNYSIGDLIARYKIKLGYNVLHPMGWDAFGLPAENAAIEKNVHPKEWTYINIANMKSELKRLGLSYDWTKEIATCDPDYYKYQQELFLEFLKNNLIYRKESVVNWDPVDQTVLSNEQVEDGKGWRSGALVVRKKLTQWFVKITDFAEELLAELKNMDRWPEHVKAMQEKWIGKSSGAKVKFRVQDSNEFIEIFTTTPETLFGVSFCALSFEHPIALKLAGRNQEIKDFIEQCSISSVSEESIETAEKLGIDTGLKVVNPVNNNQLVPVYIANFVLMNYGTGAIFGCPAHDIRDYEFAQKYNLPITQVVFSDKDESLPLKVEQNYILKNSGFLTGLTAGEAKKTIIEYLEKNEQGEQYTQYRLRDWGVSRQRYWGCPIPVIHCDDCGIVPVPKKDLPVLLPDDVDISGKGNPLDHHPTWKHVFCPKCGKAARRETDTLDTFVDSSWYFLRYCSPKDENIIDKSAVDYWLPVDNYVGGIEHAVLHLLYSRFFTKALKKLGYVKFDEPFKSLLTQGMVTHMSYKDLEGKWVSATDVYQEGQKFFSRDSNKEVYSYRIEKMSKSKKNVVPPIPIINSFGADTARMFVLSDSPPEKNLEWTDSGIEGCSKFLNRLYNFVSDFIDSQHISDEEVSAITIQQKDFLKKIHLAIKKTTENIELTHFNKAIACIREFSNVIYAYEIQDKQDAKLMREAIETVLQLLNPIVPHITEELWEMLGHSGNMLVAAHWPQYNSKFIEDNVRKITVQINGKFKLVQEFSLDMNQSEIKDIIMNLEIIKRAIADKFVKNIIFVQGKLINIVVV
jgi:leucyl-tRNA synthetase